MRYDFCHTNEGARTRPLTHDDRCHYTWRLSAMAWRNNGCQTSFTADVQWMPNVVHSWRTIDAKRRVHGWRTIDAKRRSRLTYFGNAKRRYHGWRTIVYCIKRRSRLTVHMPMPNVVHGLTYNGCHNVIHLADVSMDAKRRSRMLSVQCLCRNVVSTADVHMDAQTFVHGMTYNGCRKQSFTAVRTNFRCHNVDSRADVLIWWTKRSFTCWRTMDAPNKTNNSQWLTVQWMHKRRSPSWRTDSMPNVAVQWLTYNGCQTSFTADVQWMPNVVHGWRTMDAQRRSQPTYNWISISVPVQHRNGS